MYIPTYQRRLEQGYQIFYGETYQNGGKYTTLSLNIPNAHKIYQLAFK
jgi:hypothetical protein